MQSGEMAMWLIFRKLESSFTGVKQTGEKRKKQATSTHFVV